MASLWPWLMVAGAGALHGLNPCSGWLLAAACGVRSRDRQQSLRALWPIALGHAASIAMVAAAVARGVSMDTRPLQLLSGALLVVFLIRVLRRRAPRLHAPAGRAGLALSSFMASTLHGSGMMLVPALVPLCLGDSPAKEITASASLLLALGAVGVHTMAMLAVTGLVAFSTCRAIDAARRRLGEMKRLAREESGEAWW